RLRAFIDDRDTALQALGMLGQTPSSAGADVLYDVWVGTRSRTETTWLAEQLVFSPEVRKRASRALQVALDLRTTEDCESLKNLLTDASDHADARSARLLARLRAKRGCGERGRDDCYACLRELDKNTDKD